MVYKYDYYAVIIGINYYKYNKSNYYRVKTTCRLLDYKISKDTARNELKIKMFWSKNFCSDNGVLFCRWFSCSYASSQTFEVLWWNNKKKVMSTIRLWSFLSCRYLHLGILTRVFAKKKMRVIRIIK